MEGSSGVLTGGSSSGSGTTSSNSTAPPPPVTSATNSDTEPDNPTSGVVPATGDSGDESSSGEPILPVAVLDFSFETSTYNGVYTPENSIAVWIEQDGDYIRTLQLRCDVRCRHLVAYRLSSGDDTYDAMTSASDIDHAQTKVGTWDLLDNAGVVVPDDADYELWIEVTEDNSDGNGILGPTFSVPFRLDQSHFVTQDDSQFIHTVVLDAH